MSHKAKVLAIHCIDLRFQQMIDKDLVARVPYGEFDRISWPGASIDFENVKGASAISLKLHDPDEIVIYEHEDCGAYGEDNSLETHKNNAQKLVKALREIKPRFQAVTLIATFEGIKQL